jgi:hypothetical protein
VLCVSYQFSFLRCEPIFRRQIAVKQSGCTAVSGISIRSRIGNVVPGLLGGRASYEEKLLGRVSEDTWRDLRARWREEEGEFRKELATITPPSGGKNF